MSDINIAWIGLDWGTSNLRAYAIDQNGCLVGEKTSEMGMGVLSQEEFEPALIDLIKDWLSKDKTMPVFACGMVGARQGWLEANYRSVPCSPVSGQRLTRVETSDPRIHVEILPGLSQATPADVMRGEETQIAGLLTESPNFSGAVCLPGTHSKWVQVKNGEVVSFQTFMTGELFSLLSNHSVLRHSVCANGFDEDAFMGAALSIVADPSALATKLFSIRARSLLQDQDAQAASACLSGLLIGQELGLVRDLWDGKSVVVIGSIEVTALYRNILTELDVNVRHVEATTATLAGLKIAANQSVLPISLSVQT